MKKLLKESDVRRMMKYANISTLSESFLDRLEEEDIDEMMGDDAEEEEMGAAPDMGDDPAPPEMGDMGDEGPADDVDPAVAKATEAIVTAVVDALDAVPGAPPVSMDKGEDDVDMDAMADDPGAPPEDDDPIDEIDSALEEAEIELEEDGLAENEEFVNEVARRVAKRILESRKR